MAARKESHANSGTSDTGDTYEMRRMVANMVPERDPHTQEKPEEKNTTTR